MLTSFLLAGFGVVASLVLLAILAGSVMALNTKMFRAAAKMDVPLRALGLLGAVSAALHMLPWAGFDYIAAALFPLGLACVIEAMLASRLDKGVSLTNNHTSHDLRKYYPAELDRLSREQFLRHARRMPLTVAITVLTCAAALIVNFHGWYALVATLVGDSIALVLRYNRRRLEAKAR